MKTLKVLGIAAIGLFGYNLFAKGAEIKKSIKDLKIIPVGINRLRIERGVLKGAIDLLIENLSDVSYKLKIKEVKVNLRGKTLAGTPISNYEVAIPANSKEILAGNEFYIELNGILENLQILLIREPLNGNALIEVAGVEVNVPFKINL